MFKLILLALLGLVESTSYHVQTGTGVANSGLVNLISSSEKTDVAFCLTECNLNSKCVSLVYDRTTNSVPNCFLYQKSFHRDEMVKKETVDFYFKTISQETTSNSGIQNPVLQSTQPPLSSTSAATTTTQSPLSSTSVSTTTTTQMQTCYPGWISFANQKCFKAFDNGASSTTWSQAVAQCETMNATLAIVPTQAVLDFFLINFKSRDFWVGASTNSSGTEAFWLDGSVFTFTIAPDLGDCVVYADNKPFFYHTCSSTLQYLICERQAE